MEAMHLALSNGRDYNFLGHLGWFTTDKFATAGVYPHKKGCEKMLDMHFAADIAVLNDPATLVVSVFDWSSPEKLDEFYTQRSWIADTGDIYRVAFMLAISKATHDKNSVLLTKLVQCASNVLVYSETDQMVSAPASKPGGKSGLGWIRILPDISQHTYRVCAEAPSHTRFTVLVQPMDMHTSCPGNLDLMR